MNREEIVENIQFSKKKLFNLENMYSELGRLQKPFIQLWWWAHIFVYIIYFSILAKVSEWILTPFESVLENYINADFYFYSFIIVSLISYILLYNFIAKTLNVSKKFSKESRIEELKTLIREEESSLHNTVIPKTYQSSWFAQEIEKMFLNQRADTIKEAINLLVEDNKHRQSMQNIETLKKLQLETLNQTKIGNRIGWVNLLTKR